MWLKILFLISVLYKQFIHGCNSDGRAGDEPWSLQKHPRNGGPLSVWFTVSCDRRIFVRACLHFVSFGAASRLVLFPRSPLHYLQLCRIFLRLQPFLFFRSQRSALPRGENTSRIRVRAMKWWRLTRARTWRWTLRRFNERYYDLVALDIVHINPRGTLILENLELSRVVPTRASRQSRGEFINRSRKKKQSPPAPKKDDRTRPEAMNVDCRRDAKN